MPFPIALGEFQFILSGEILFAEKFVFNNTSSLHSGQVGKRQIQEHLGTIFLILDELTDQR